MATMRKLAIIRYYKIYSNPKLWVVGKLGKTCVQLFQVTSSFLDAPLLFGKTANGEEISFCFDCDCDLIGGH